jgi:hypothetical protein
MAGERAIPALPDIGSKVRLVIYQQHHSRAGVLHALRHLNCQLLSIDVTCFKNDNLFLDKTTRPPHKNLLS